MADVMTITWPNIGELMDDLAAAGANATPLMNAALTNGAGEIQRAVRARAPHDTGTLQRSVEIEADNASGSLSTDFSRNTVGSSLVVKVNEKYGAYLEYGTGLYGPLGRRITPKSARVLAWTSKGGGKVFARSTAGMRKQPFFWLGVEEATPLVYEQFDIATKFLVDELAGSHLR